MQTAGVLGCVCVALASCVLLHSCVFPHSCMLHLCKLTKNTEAVGKIHRGLFENMHKLTERTMARLFFN